MATTGACGRGGAGSSASIDALQRLLADLCHKGTNKDAARAALKKHVKEEYRDLSGEAFSRFMDQLYDRRSGLIDSNEVSNNLGAFHAIVVLIEVKLGESASKVSKISAYIRNVFESKRDPEILMLASRTCGCLVQTGGAMIVDEVERQVCSFNCCSFGSRVLKGSIIVAPQWLCPMFTSRLHWSGWVGKGWNIDVLRLY
ncbi:Serine/threonine-protein kinase [Nymphaea thermarum]|nr:Serine/threonine-protein kinase [Nymphaea thermarum]